MSTIWRTKKRRKEHGLVHEETQKTHENSTIWCTTELRKEHDLVPYTRPLLHQAGAPPWWCVWWMMYSSLMAVITSSVGSDNSWTVILFLLILEDFGRCAMWDHKKLLQLSWMDGFGAGNQRDFMVHHLGAGFSKNTFCWLLQHTGNSQYIYIYIYI